MKTVILITMCLAIATVCYAETTGGQNFSSPNGCVDDDFIAFLNDQEYIDHNHQYVVPETDRNDPYGIGADVIIWENESKNVALEVQGKYDYPNKETSGFLVAKINLWEMLKKKAE